ncbi:hypothetical protein EVAR_60088_1 [Eumeta japonica]|uniref:Uncharacterized protein n=1 Tax=Eumeta variegata TaxID=151549 RepID=A0A4C1YN49_EUMVA|nr:hypothetical protein EVAR_60088_1 [Eumeta japonica]
MSVKQEMCAKVVPYVVETIYIVGRGLPFWGIGDENIEIMPVKFTVRMIHVTDNRLFVCAPSVFALKASRATNTNDSLPSAAVGRDVHPAEQCMNLSRNSATSRRNEQ